MSPMKAVRPRVSYADLERSPEDGRRYELYDGEAFVVPAPLPKHQVVQATLTELFRKYARERGGFAVDSPIDIVFSEFDVLQPDVVYFSPDRAHFVDLNRVIRDAPDVCVEVLSPSTAATDRGKKMQMFARYRVPHYWIVDPAAESIEIYELRDTTYEMTVNAVAAGNAISPPAMPGLTFTVGSLFPSR
jgi:Uma2 family endonuclease